MALRMILVAMVVAMSLPIPNTSRCNQLLQELKAEFSETISSLQNEWPGPEETAQPIETTVAQDAVTPVAEMQTDSQFEPAALESPLELAFSVIVEEFAHEAANQHPVHQAKSDLAVIPMPDMNHPLPPAPEANELLVHQHTLALIDPPSLVVHRLDGPIHDWERETICLIQPEAEPISSLIEPARVVSQDIGPWADLITEISTTAEFETATNEQLNVPTATNPPLPGHWLEIIEIAQMESASPSQFYPPQEQSPVVITKALRLTVEALAAWTQVVSRPY